MARPKADINPLDVIDLASIGCKTTEIAIKLGCSTDTLDRRFAAELALGRVNLKINLRRAQIAMSKKNPNMQMFLGKQYLDQSDKVESTVDSTTKTEVLFIAEWAAPVKETA